MNKSYFKMSRRGIRKSISRFLSIVSIVALGTGFLAGLSATAPDMFRAANDFYHDTKTYDVLVRGTLGLTKDDQKAILREGFVEEAELVYQKDELYVDENQESLTTRVMERDFAGGKLNSKVNDLVLLEGRFPKAKDECVIEIPSKFSYKSKIGMVYQKDGSKKKYKTVGIVRSSLYISEFGDVTDIGTGRIGLGMYIMPQKERETFTALYARYTKDDYIDTYGDEYKEMADENDQIIKDLAVVRNKIRTEEIKKEQLDKLEESKDKLSREKTDAYDKIEEGRQTIAVNLAEVNEGFKEVRAGRIKILEEEKKLKAAEADLDSKAGQIEEARAALEAGYPVSDEIRKAIAEYDRAREQVRGGLAEIQVQKGYLVNQINSLKGAKEKLNTALVNLEASKAEADGKFKEAEDKIAEAQKKIDDIKNGKWIVDSRLDNIGISGYKGDVDKVAAIAKIFPIFFFLVAALVALTTMTRMIEEERGQIGTLKSLGYNNSNIRNYYLGYGLLASLVGCVVGQSIGFVVFPKIISNAYSMMYTVPEIKAEFIPSISAKISIAIVLCILFTSYMACRKELKEKPAALLLPKAPPAGKRILLERITPVWSRLKFTRKVTLRNLFRYKKRFLMTIVGIAGCTALLLTGFGVRDSVGNIVNLQYGEIYTYDYTIMLDDEDFRPDSQLIKDYALVHDETGKLKTKGKTEEIKLRVLEDKNCLDKIAVLRERIGGKEISVDDNTVIVSEKTAEVLGVEVGDMVTVVTHEGHKKDIEIGGISENYVDNLCYMTEKLFVESYGDDCEYNNMLAIGNFDKYTVDEITERLLEEDGVTFVSASKDIKKTFQDSVKNIDYIIFVLILSAGGLAAIVLYNLTNVNICERKKEIATIKVLGFYEREAASYIFREINMLSYIGIIVGIPVGVLLHQFVIRTVEVGGVMFGRSIAPLSFILAAVLTVVFTKLVNLLMSKKIRDVDMASSMKAID